MEPAAAACNGHTWFLGIVYDSQQRNDFQLDVDNFEKYRARLQATHCFPDSQAKILAFENGYTRNGKTYEEGSEAKLNSYLTSFGAAASGFADSQFFFFLSSHGSLSVLSCGLRQGSFSALKGGSLTDCELGSALNTRFAPHVRMFVMVDCSFCGGFSDSLTAASGTVRDDSPIATSGVPGPKRIVVTGCAITTECFGSDGGGVSYKYFSRVMGNAVIACDGFTAPGFPIVQGVDAQANVGQFLGRDGRCSASEWFFAAVHRAYLGIDPIAVQQQFRIKYGPATLAEDLTIF